ncbi:hypothetical protein TeGR_g422 [Tetraparma gracilis]|uniref:Formamidopyrimidine-DNA glycosylase H2TH DNA-binding domain-containing protein n=1 Tax=Tetraparma gracilis TaxID=2962635 RepID=A0ABQ6MK22_9STRA|nr:hypothetical protein TeGR_g422 [Tetraparma gracilis]
MSGRFLFTSPRLRPPPGPAASAPPLPHRHARVTFTFVERATGEEKDLTFVDARNFGTVRCSADAGELEEKLGSLGPDILGGMTKEDFLGVVGRLRNRTNVCKLLMNQKRLCGVGNYILAEGLYKAGVDPWCDAQDLGEETLVRLFEELQDTAAKSYRAQGVTRGSGGSYRQLDDTRGEFEFELECYGRGETPGGERVYKIVDGPHKRAIHFVLRQVGEDNIDMVKARLNIT